MFKRKSKCPPKVQESTPKLPPVGPDPLELWISLAKSLIKTMEAEIEQRQGKR